MAETPKSDDSMSPPAERMHWAVSYLREDFQDLRLEMRGQIADIRHQIHDIRQQIQNMRQEIGDTRKELIQRIDGVEHRIRRELSTRFYWLIGLLFASWLSTMGTLLIKL